MKYVWKKHRLVENSQRKVTTPDRWGGQECKLLMSNFPRTQHSLPIRLIFFTKLLKNNKRWTFWGHTGMLVLGQFCQFSSCSRLRLGGLGWVPCVLAAVSLMASVVVIINIVLTVVSVENVVNRTLIHLVHRVSGRRRVLGRRLVDEPPVQVLGLRQRYRSLRHGPLLDDGGRRRGVGRCAEAFPSAPAGGDRRAGRGADGPTAGRRRRARRAKPAARRRAVAGSVALRRTTPCDTAPFRFDAVNGRRTKLTGLCDDRRDAGKFSESGVRDD